MYAAIFSWRVVLTTYSGKRCASRTGIHPGLSSWGMRTAGSMIRHLCDFSLNRDTDRVHRPYRTEIFDFYRFTKTEWGAGNHGRLIVRIQPWAPACVFEPSFISRISVWPEVQKVPVSVNTIGYIWHKKRWQWRSTKKSLFRNNQVWSAQIYRRPPGWGWKELNRYMTVKAIKLHVSFFTTHIIPHRTW